MNELVAELEAVAVELLMAGVPATHDPAGILQLVAGRSAAALVARPEEIRPGIGMAALDMDVPVWLLTAGPDDLHATDRLYTMGLLAWPVAMPVSYVTRDTYTVGETTLPALRWETARRIPYPNVMSPRSA